jgi:DNA-binding response OmpR family regulator
MRDSSTGGWVARELAAICADMRPPIATHLRRRGRICAAARLRAAMTEQRSTILVVEDDRHTRTFLADNLAADGYEPIGAANARDALRLMETRYPDLAIVDLTLPDRDGLELLKQVRAADGVASRIDPHLPLLVLSGRVGELHRLRGFDKGADDVMGKPFSYPELRARVKALLRRAERSVRHGRLRVGTLEIDPAARTVLLNGRRLVVSQKEFALLRTLAADPTRVFTKDELLRTLWGYRTSTSGGSTRTLDSHACRLRQKLARDGDRYLVNVWGVGYRLVDGPVGEAAGPEAAR